MSKKLSITIPNKVRPNLINLFRSYLSNRKESDEFDYDSYYENWDSDGILDFWDREFPGWDDLCDIKSRKRNKHKSKRKKNRGKCKVIDINTPYSIGDDDFSDAEYVFPYETENDELKEIWFYPDYHCKDDRLEFNTIKEFSDYCESMGYSVPNSILGDIIWRYESHCCLDPSSEKVGLLEVMSSNTYGSMFYDACDVNELGD